MTITRHRCGRCHDFVDADDPHNNAPLPPGWATVQIIAQPISSIKVCPACLRKIRALMINQGGLRAALAENA